MGAVERCPAEADHRRLSAVARRLVWTGLAQPAHVAMGASAVGLWPYSVWCDGGPGDLDVDLVVVTCQGADRPSGNVTELQVRSIAARHERTRRVSRKSAKNSPHPPGFRLKGGRTCS